MSQCLSSHRLEGSPKWGFLALWANFTSFKKYAVVLESLSYILPFKSPSLRYAPWSVMVDPLFPRKAHPSQLTIKEKQQDQSRVGPQVILNRWEEWLPTSNRSFPLIHRTRAWTKHQVHNVGLCLITLHSFPDGFLMSFPDSSVSKESSCNTGDPSSIPGLERSTDEGIGYPLQYSWASLVAQLIKICL